MDKYENVHYNTNQSSTEKHPLLVQVHHEKATGPSWVYPGWGKSTNIDAPEGEIEEIRKTLSSEKQRLSEWPATAICGNDILSSCLYVSGLVALKAGKLAPVALGLVCAVLYLFRFVYEEVINAIPLNGGSYNVLLNTTSKRIASFAACLAILSYIATGVVSGTSACTYLSTQVTSISVVPATLTLLLFFAILAFIGITESSIVALIIFIGHVTTLIVLCVYAVLHAIQNPHILQDNLNTEYPPVDLAGRIVDGNIGTALFFGLGAAMLGISGFETSSQFVEEQQDGVFPKTLRNMWIGVFVFNPLLSFLCLCVMPLYGDDGIIANKNIVLAHMGKVVGGEFLESWVSIDAFIVLSGAVLTAYVGITGLVRRLASDRVLPAFLLRKNTYRQTNHYIIFGYFIVASSLVVALNADVATLSGVYTYAFLGLMTLFASGCMLLKVKRAEIPRTVHAPWLSCILAIIMVLIGFFANLLGDPTVLTYFALYFIAVLLIVFVMFERITILRVCMYVLQRTCPSSARRPRTESSTGAIGGRTIAKAIKDINESPILFFCKKPDLTTINKAILYVRNNEQTSNLVVVHIYERGEEVPQELIQVVALFDRIYPKLKLDCLAIAGSFGPPMIEWISRTRNVPKNMMFIKQPDHNFAHKIASLGGVRVITG